MNEEHTSDCYEAAGFFLLRAPLLPASVFTEIATETVAQSASTPDLTNRLSQIRQLSYERLHVLMKEPMIAHALLAASPDLFEGMIKFQRGQASPRQIERLSASFLRYLTRMSTRPTPFGLFAGIAIGSFSQVSTAQIGPSAIQKIRTRPDMDWIFSLIRRIEQDKQLRPDLQVIANHTVYLAGDQAILPYADIYGQHDTRVICLGATSAVLLVLERATLSIPYAELSACLQDAFPEAGEEQIEGLLQQLWDHHFLMSDLRPPLTSAHPELYVLERLRNIPAAAPLADGLQAVVDKAKEADAGTSAKAIQSLHEMMILQQKLLPEQTRHLFQIDTVVNLEETQLQHSIGQAAVEAVETLLRLSHPTENRHHLSEYLLCFLERYGLDAEVPLLDVLNPEFGLDAPPGYTEPARGYPLPPLPAPDSRGRDAILCTLLVEAIQMQKQEIELTDEILERLTQWKPEEYSLPPALELFMQIEASSKEALDRDEWRGIITPTGAAYGGRTFCRFFDIMGEAGLENLREYTRREEELYPDVLFAELSYLPSAGRGANVAVRPALRAYEVVVNTTPSVSPEHVISLDDLVVGVRANRFYIRSLSHRKELIVTQSHLLNPQFAPNICRFLLEASHSRWSSISSFHWGVSSSAPFLPRLIRKKMVLSPAQWNLFPSMLVLEKDDEAGFFEAIQAWRRLWRVPRYVSLKFFDNTLLLDLEHPLFLIELRHELEKAKAEQSSVLLLEALPEATQLWLRDQKQQPYFAELVVPLLARRNSIALRKRMGAKIYPRSPLSLLERRQLPGGDWAYLKLYLADKHHDLLIAGPLRAIACMLREEGLSDRWFFLRYADPEPHLRIRFHASEANKAQQLLYTLLDWGQELVESGQASNFSLEAYDREIERYGGPEAIDVVEGVFAANSHSICEILAALEQEAITLEPLALAVFTLDQLLKLWGFDDAQRLAYVQSQPLMLDEKEVFRSQRKFLCELLHPWDYDPQYEQLVRLCLTQKPLLQKAHEHIRLLADRDALWMPEEYILQSLAHMHLNRLLGINQEREKRIYAFWRYTLESLQKRPTQKMQKQEKKIS